MATWKTIGPRSRWTTCSSCFRRGSPRKAGNFVSAEQSAGQHLRFLRPDRARCATDGCRWWREWRIWCGGNGAGYSVSASDHPHRHHRDGFCQRNGHRGQADQGAVSDGDSRLAQVVQHRKMPHGLAGGLGRFLDLDGMDRVVPENQQIDFLLVLVAVEVERSALAVVPIAFDDFRNHPSFQESAVHGSGFQGFGGTPLGEVGGQAGVQEVELGRFHQALVVVGVIGFQQVDDPRRHQ